MSNDMALPLGVDDEGNLFPDPYPDLSRLVIGPSGSNKTTGSVVPTIQGLIPNHDVAINVNDIKSGEVFAQILPVAEKYGRKIGCIDDFGIYGFDNPYRLNISPFGAVIAAAIHTRENLFFAIKTATHGIIPEVDDGGRNFSFRELPRQKIHLCILMVLEMLPPSMLTPGVVYETMANPETWRSMRQNAASDGSPSLKARAQISLDMEENDPEAYYKHLNAALTSLEMYEPGSVLNSAGANATITHDELVRDGWIVCTILPQLHAEMAGLHSTLHQQAFMEAQLSGRGGRLVSINDELCNSINKEEVKRVTIQRASKKSSIYIAQTLADIEKMYGKHDLAILLDNCPVKQFLAFSNYDDAEKVSRAMGEEISVQQSISVNPQATSITGNISTGMQRVMTASELMNLDPAYQIIHIKGEGWFLLKKVFQNQLAPTCHDLGLNPQEGNRRLPPDPKFTLPTSFGGAQ